VAEGPADALNATERTQPAMLSAGVATWRVWNARGGALPAVLSGHSLGEFTALVCAQALKFPAAVELVRYRGELMQQAVPAGSGAMAAILGLEDAQIKAACAEAAQGAIVEPANFNSPGQVVIAGDAAAVARAIEAARARGAKRAVLLPVSVPAHSSLMRAAAQRLAERLGALDLGRPKIRYVSAVDAAAHEEPEDIRALLVRQLSSPVRWTDTLRAVSAAPIAQVIECGPGKVLTALNRRIERRDGLSFLALEDPASLQAALTATRGDTHA
jgi:[acyl-carrier-protein] S-malonyltransferase